MSSVRTILAGLFTALGGFFLLALTAAAGFAIYLATAPDNAVSSAAADAVSSRPLMRAEAASAPRQKVAWLASPPPARPLNAPTPASNSKARIRQLQNALVRAECYDGPISGIWSDATKDAMRGFVQKANAELPVGRPDDALVALVESNETVKCEFGRSIATGALGVGTSLQVAAPSSHAPALTASDNAKTKDAPTTLERVWAPAGMLTLAKESTDSERAGATATKIASAPTPAAQQMTASNDPAPTNESQPVSPPLSAAHFEGGKPLAAIQQIEEPPIASRSAPEASPEPHAKPKKTKSAKRRRAKYDGVEATISKGFDSLQRSIASMF
ncbi:MAG: peptidoglycan-binding protein [Proteobacteria bacterium]|nr:peptidoglycan-binding protein [Pseudomonadota bacterium]